MKNFIKPVLMASLFASVSSVYAADEAVTEASSASPHSLSTNIGFFTDYTFRGISYGRERGAIQGGIDYAHSSGFYVGAWASNVEKDALAGNTVELDLYGGYATALTQDIGINVGFLQFYYPDNNHTGENGVGGSPNTTELNAAVSYKYFTLKDSYAVTNFFGLNNASGGNGNSRGSNYIELNVAYPLPISSGLNLALHVGRQTVHNYSELNYTDWLIGINKDFEIAGTKGWNAGVNFTTTNADDDLYVDYSAGAWETANSRAVGYIKRTF
jgi:uncharacterized protein (TIGR02001 family)